MHIRIFFVKEKPRRNLNWDFFERSLYGFLIENFIYKESFSKGNFIRKFNIPRIDFLVQFDVCIFFQFIIKTIPTQLLQYFFNI